MALRHRFTEKQWESHCYYTIPFVGLCVFFTAKCSLLGLQLIGCDGYKWCSILLITLPFIVSMMDIFWGHFPTVGVDLWIKYKWWGESGAQALKHGDELLEQLLEHKPPETFWRRVKAMYSPEQWHTWKVAIPSLIWLWMVTAWKISAQFYVPLHWTFPWATIALDVTWWGQELYSAIRHVRQHWRAETAKAHEHPDPKRREMYAGEQWLTIWLFVVLGMLVPVMIAYHCMVFFGKDPLAEFLASVCDDFLFVKIPFLHMLMWWNKNYVKEQLELSYRRAMHAEEKAKSA